MPEDFNKPKPWKQFCSTLVLYVLGHGVSVVFAYGLDFLISGVELMRVVG